MISDSPLIRPRRLSRLVPAGSITACASACQGVHCTPGSRAEMARDHVLRWLWRLNLRRGLSSDGNLLFRIRRGCKSQGFHACWPYVGQRRSPVRMAAQGRTSRSVARQGRSGVGATSSSRWVATKDYIPHLAAVVLGSATSAVARCHALLSGLHVRGEGPRITSPSGFVAPLSCAQMVDSGPNGRLYGRRPAHSRAMH